MIRDILFFFYKAILAFLKLAGKGELMKDEIDAVLDVLYYVVIVFEECDISIIDIVVCLIVFFNSYIDIVLVYDFDVVHVLVNDVLVNLSDFLSKVEKIFVITIPNILQFSTVK